MTMDNHDVFHGRYIFKWLVFNCHVSLWGVDENAADANQGDIMDQVHVAPASRSLTI